MTYKKHISVGLALCRRCPKTQVPQVLLVRNRVTIAFAELAMGKFRMWENDYLLNLLDHMSVDEKLLVLTLDFERVWYHIWLKLPQPGDPDAGYTEFFQACKKKFERLVVADQGRRLRALINRSRSQEPGWEVPKGRLESEETELDCAVRELREETNVQPGWYRVLDNMHPVCTSLTSRNQLHVYISKYYVASMLDEHSDRDIGVRMSNLDQITEISDIRWASLKDLDHMPSQQTNLAKTVSTCLKIWKRKTRHPAVPVPVLASTPPGFLRRLSMRVPRTPRTPHTPRSCKPPPGFSPIGGEKLKTHAW